VTERTDGVTTERVTESDTGGGTVVVERRGSGAGLLIGFAVLILAIAAAFFVLNEGRNDSLETKAVTEAARSVGDAADKAGTAAEKAGDEITNN
jgi:hypothetical protein